MMMLTRRNVRERESERFARSLSSSSLYTRAGAVNFLVEFDYYRCMRGARVSGVMIVRLMRKQLGERRVGDELG